MTGIFPGRFTAKTDQSFVVLLIGMRINKLWAVHRWLPVFQAMNPMLAQLFRHPELGFLGGIFGLSPGGPLLVQYWRSFDDLERFARSPSDTHFPAWKRFYQQAGKSPAVGVWHETYLVGAGQVETLYVNMPRFGLGQVFDHLPAAGQRSSARGRLA
jgi:hypothetical protein